MAISGIDASINTYISMGPRVICEENGDFFEKVSDRPILRRTIKTIRKVFGKPPNRKHPITVEMLRAVGKTHANTNDPLKATFYAAMLVAFFTFMRKSNYTLKSANDFKQDWSKALTIGKLQKINKRFAIVLTRTKTVQLNQRQVVIWLLVLHDNPICPTRALTRMFELRRSGWNHSYSDSDPLFCQDVKGTPLLTAKFTTMLKDALKSAGFDTKYLSPHSLRRGGTIFAFEAGCSKACIKIQGDWLSDAYLLYLEITDSIKAITIECMERALS